MSTVSSFDAAFASPTNGKSSPKTSEVEADSQTAFPEENLDDFAGELYLLIPKFIALLRSLTEGATNELPAFEKVMRAMLIGGAGMGFDKSIEHAIRFYKHADAAVRKYSKPDSDVPEKLRADLLSRFNTQLREREFTLTKTLQVEIVDVQAGDPVDPEIHHVDINNQRETSTKAKVNLIAEVKSPAFRWLNEQGKYTTKPADVIAYCEKKPRASSSKDHDSRDYRRNPR